ncbi:MAG: hypothetical protein R6U59_07910 [Eubacteriales bacterium]
MFKYLINHEKQILKILESTNLENLEEIKKDHLNMITFMQHERLIHLIVTAVIGLILIMIFVAALFTEIYMLYMTTVVIIVIEIFYIRHYYLMENGVQRMYKLYDRLREKE